MHTGGTVSPARIASVVLAAGGSTRLGQPKQLLRYAGETLVARTARTAITAGCHPVVVVTGANNIQVEAALEALPSVRSVHNGDWETGMGSSTRAGILALDASGTEFDAVLLLVCDQPLVNEDVLLRLCAAHRETGSNVVASEYGGVWGVPCLFDRALLPELAALDGASGAKSVIERHRRIGDATAILFPGGAFDVDTPADWERWQELETSKMGEAA